MGKREKDDNTAKTETKVDTVHSMNPAGEGLNGIKASLSAIIHVPGWTAGIVERRMVKVCQRENMMIQNRTGPQHHEQEQIKGTKQYLMNS